MMMLVVFIEMMRGQYLGNIECELSDINPDLWKIEEEGDDNPTYLSQWDYKNSYYRISGKITEDEIREIVKNIVY